MSYHHIYVPFYNKHVTRVILVLTHIMNHEILVSLKPIKIKQFIPHANMVLIHPWFVQPTYVVWNTHTNEVKMFRNTPILDGL